MHEPNMNLVVMSKIDKPSMKVDATPDDRSAINPYGSCRLVDMQGIPQVSLLLSYCQWSAHSSGRPP